MNECPHGLFDVCCTNYDNCSIGEPKKEWVDLTHKEFAEILCDDRWQRRPELMLLEVQAKLKVKNGF